MWREIARCTLEMPIMLDSIGLLGFMGWLLSGELEAGEKFVFVIMTAIDG